MDDGVYIFVHDNIYKYSFRLIKIEKQHYTLYSNFHLYHKPGIKKLTERIYLDYMKERGYTVDLSLIFSDQFKFIVSTAFQMYKL